MKLLEQRLEEVEAAAAQREAEELLGAAHAARKRPRFRSKRMVFQWFFNGFWW